MSDHRFHARARALPQVQRRNPALTRLVTALVGLTLVGAGLLTALSAHAATQNAAPSTSSQAATLGTVQSVQPLEVKGQGSGAGVAAGAVLGGLLGNQMGKGTGNAVMTVGGAVAGGFAGNEVEKNVKKHTVYKTSVKMDDGQTRSFTLRQAYALGARVHVSGKGKVELVNGQP